MLGRESRDKIILFLLWPFAAFLYALKDIKSNSSYFIFAGFCVLFGVTFIAQNEGADSFRYVESLRQFSMEGADIWSIIAEYFTFDTNIKDLYIYVMYYLTSLFTSSNYHVFFLFVSLVFSYFYLKSMRFVTGNASFSNTLPMLLLIFLFTYSNPIFNINGVRFWTTAWVAVYLVFQVVVRQRKEYMFFLFLLPLMHAAYTMFVIFFFVIYFACKNLNVLSWLFIVSLFFSDVAYNYMDNITPYLPTFLRNMVWSYTESDNALAKMDGLGPSYARLLNALPHYFIVLLIILFIRERKRIQTDKSSKRMLLFLLGYQSLVNLCVFIPSMSRFNELSIPLVVYIWVNSYEVMKKYNKILYLIPFVYAYSLRYWLKNMLSISDPFLYLSNTFHLLLKNFV